MRFGKEPPSTHTYSSSSSGLLLCSLQPRSCSREQAYPLLRFRCSIIACAEGYTRKVPNSAMANSRRSSTMPICAGVLAYKRDILRHAHSPVLFDIVATLEDFEQSLKSGSYPSALYVATVLRAFLGTQSVSVLRANWARKPRL